MPNSSDGNKDENKHVLDSTRQRRDSSVYQHDDVPGASGDVRFLGSHGGLQAAEVKSPTTTVELSDEEMRKLLQPDPTEEQVLDILRTHYCKECEAASVEQRLDSYDDCNFKVKVAGVLYLLKIHNGVESRTLVECLKESNNDFYKEGCMKSVIHLQNAIMELCQEHNIPSNRPVRPVSFDERKKPPQAATNGSGDSNQRLVSPVIVCDLPVLSATHSPCALAVRLLSWTEGRPLSSVPNAGIDVIADAGRMLAKLDKVLDHLNVNSLEGRLDKFGSSSSLLARGSIANLHRASTAHCAVSKDQTKAKARKRGSMIMSSLPIEEFRSELMAMSTTEVSESKLFSPTQGAVLETSLLIPARRYHQWDGKNTVDLRKFTDYIVDARRKDLVLSILDTFQEEIVATHAAEKFRIGVIHGDFNDANILVDENLSISGVIDFGDSVESWRILEISVAMAYAMLTSFGRHNLSLSAAAGMLRGYNSVYPLTDGEKKHLPLLIACRLACSVTLGAYSYSQNTENKYLLLHAEPAWRALETIWPSDEVLRGEMRRAASRLFEQACLYGTAREGSVTCYDLIIPDPGVADLLEAVRVKWLDTSGNGPASASLVPPQKKQRLDNSNVGDRKNPAKPTIAFVTGNAKKLEEVERILGSGPESPFLLTSRKVDLPELQGDPINIAREKCLSAAEAAGGGVITEDTSLCFTALNGLPGPYIKWFLDSCGHGGLNKMIAAYEDKSAYAQTVVAFCSGPGHEPVIFDGRTYGKIVPARGSLEFGWDPIFEPNEGEGKTYAEMTKDEKDSISHRSRAFQQLREYFRKFSSDLAPN